MSENGVIVGTIDAIDDLRKKSYRYPERLAKDDFTSFNEMDKLLIAALWSNGEVRPGTASKVSTPELILFLHDTQY